MISEVFNMDCVIGMKDYPDNYFDLAVVDPPYGIGMSGGKFGNSKKDFKQFAGGDKSIPSKEYFNEMIRVSKNYIVWGGNYMTEHLPPTSCFIVWDKVQPESFSMAMCELAITSLDSPAKIVKHRVVGAYENGKIHPTEKPIKLYEWIYLNYLPDGGKVIDTHLGSGSNRIAADKQGNIEFVGYELDKDYFEAQEKRWKEYKSQLKLF